MVIMGVGEDEMVLEALLLKKPVPETPDSRPRIHNDDLVVPGSDLDTGCVSTVFQIILTRDGN
jgi:hypothetical protein